MRVLVLGGTGEARVLAAALVARGDHVVSSLAGRVARPRLPVGEVRIGGFGGVEGLREVAASFDAVVDATHPFARRISANAAAACDVVPLVRLARPGWEPRPGWRIVHDHRSAARRTAQLGRRPFLTVGRQDLGAFTGPLATHEVVARVVDPPEVAVPSSWRLLLDRGPYTLDGELALMREHGVDVLVTKDSGGAMTQAKLDAATRLDLPVVVVRRPAPPVGVPLVASVPEALAWLGSLR